VPYKVFIPTAGVGSRLNHLTKSLNKSLVAIESRTILSLIIDKFPSDTEFVIAVGYKADLVRQFLELAYSNTRIQIVNIDPYEGVGSGLGHTLMCCKQYLLEPFVFISCDTVVIDEIPPPTSNWMGYSAKVNEGTYRQLVVEDQCVTQILEQNSLLGDLTYSYIGLAGIHDFETFWETMSVGATEMIAIGETYGLKALIASGITAYQFDWFDTGNLPSLKIAKEYFKSPNSPHILEKENEALWFSGNLVIKYSSDQDFIRDRLRRASVLAPYIPEINGATANMYSYKFVDGVTLSRVVSPIVFQRFLGRATQFWNEPVKAEITSAEFKSICLKFYHDKTNDRVQQYLHNKGIADKDEIINGVFVPRVSELIQLIDWDWISSGTQSNFHGDFHFENVILTSDNNFVFIDWRQNFGGGIEVGDRYYDLAKILHGIIVSHQAVTNLQFSIKSDHDRKLMWINRKTELLQCEELYLTWLENEQYDVTKVQVLTAMIFLNIAPLHHSPYSEFLFALGKRMLHDVLSGRPIIMSSTDTTSQITS